ncbi:MAG: hypothetical protein ACC661_01520 [Verrucomicrobiales bacterium]
MSVAPAPGRSRAGFWGLAASLGLVWIAFAALSQGFVYGSAQGERPFLGLLGVLGLAFALYLVAAFRFWSEDSGGVRGRDILLVALLLRVPLIFWSQPVQEIDYFRYLWDGRVLVNGVSPYRFSPADLDQWLEAAPEEGSSEARKLVAVLDRSPPIQTIFRSIDHREVPTIYPAASQLVFTTAAWLTPESAPVSTHLIVLRSILALFDLGVVALLLAILRRTGLPAGRAIAYGWCPLVLKEFANSSHMDVIAIFLVSASFLFAIRGLAPGPKSGRANAARNRPGKDVWIAAALWSASVLAKWYPLILAPLYFSAGWRRWRWRVMLPASLGVALVFAGQLALRPGQDPASPSASPADQFTGLRTFMGRWEMNDLVFSVVHENLRPAAGAGQAQPPLRQPWYALTPEPARHRWDAAVRATAAHFGVSASRLDPAFLTAQAISAALILSLLLWLCLRPPPREEDGARRLGWSVFALLAAAWFLGATQNPWYWAWALPFIGFARSRVWLWVSGLALVYYLRFWLIYHYPDPVWGGLNGRKIFDEVVIWGEHLPFLLVLGWLALRQLRRAR